MPLLAIRQAAARFTQADLNRSIRAAKAGGRQRRAAAAPQWEDPDRTSPGGGRKKSEKGEFVL
ncbi:MAG: hypothetical protein WAV72_14090 [Bradyrhizobium sp.]